MKRLALALLATLPAFSAGSVGQSINPLGPGTPNSGLPDTRTYVMSVTWIGDSVNGTVPATSINITTLPQIQGYRLFQMEVQPGTPSPTANYSVTLVDSFGVDLLQGQGASLSATNAFYAGSITSPPLLNSPTFNLSGNSVASARGTVTLYFAPVPQAPINTGLAGVTGNNTFSGTNNFTGPFAVNAAGTGPATGAVNGDITAAESATTGVVRLGSDGNSSIARVGNALNLNAPNAGGTVVASNNLLVPTTLTTPSGAGNVISQQCSTSQRTESAADANLLTCAIPAVAGTYRVRFVLNVSAANAATLGWTFTYTDSNGTAQTPTNQALSTLGSVASQLTYTISSPSNFYGYTDVDVNNAGTSIVVKLTFSGTSFTGKASATVERII